MRDAITPAELSAVSADTPVTLIGSTAGYAVAVGPMDRVRWLHTTTHQFRLFSTADRAVTLLRAHGIRRITIDTTGGTPQ